MERVRGIEQMRRAAELQFRHFPGSNPWRPSQNRALCPRADGGPGEIYFASCSKGNRDNAATPCLMFSRAAPSTAIRLRVAPTMASLVVAVKSDAIDCCQSALLVAVFSKVHPASMFARIVKPMIGDWTRKIWTARR